MHLIQQSVKKHRGSNSKLPIRCSSEVVCLPALCIIRIRPLNPSLIDVHLNRRMSNKEYRISKCGLALLLRFEISCSIFKIFLPVAITPL